MNYQIRQATAEDIRPALDLALRVFMEYDSIDYGLEHTERMRLSIEERITNPDFYLPGNRLMFVDSDYQRQGIATLLMNRMASELKKSGYDTIVLNSSPNGLHFYKHFGFTVNETEKNMNTPWKTPMSYAINEISES